MKKGLPCQKCHKLIGAGGPTTTVLEGRREGMQTYRELTRAVAKRRPEMLEMIGRAGSGRIPHRRPGGGQPLRSPAGEVDPGHRGQEQPQSAEDSRRPVDRPLWAGAGNSPDAAGPPGHRLAAGHAQKDALPGARGPGLGSRCTGHEGRGGDGAYRAAGVGRRRPGQAGHLVAQ